MFGRPLAKPSIRFYLVAIVVIVALPIVALVALLLIQLEDKENSILAARVSGGAYSIASGVSLQLQDMSTTLHILASAPELTADDLEAFHRRVGNALRPSDYYVLAVRADGQQLLNTRVPYGTALNATSNPEHLANVLAAQKLDVSGVFFGAVSGRWVFNLTMPLAPESARSVAALIITQDVSDLSEWIPTEGLIPGWSAALIDQDGVVIFSSAGSNMSTGEKVPAELTARMTQFRGVVDYEFGAPETLVAYARVPGWGWRALVWGPTAVAQEAIGDAWRWLIVGGVALLAGAFAVAAALGQRIRRSIVDIASMATQLGSGAIVAPVETSVREADMVARVLSEASFDRGEAEERMHIVQRELVHRTKNLLAVVQSILNQTARQSTSLKEFQSAATKRFEGLGRSIDLLTAAGWAGVDMRTVVESHLATFAGTPSRIAVHGRDFVLRGEAVQALGLALHELATNAVKYGALSVPGGTVTLDWRDGQSAKGEATMEISWTERGGPPVTAPSETGFGTMVLDRITAATFRGTVEMDYAPAGLTWRISGPRDAFIQSPLALAEAGSAF